MELYLLRHAHAGDASTWTGPDDTRPLSDKGRTQSERLGRFLAGVGFVPDAIISSPKLRARETAEIVAGHLGLEVTARRRAGRRRWIPRPWTASWPRPGDPVRPILVGHDPDFSELITVLCDAGPVPMRKGALARIDVDRPLEPRAGTLRWLVPPDLLKPER